MTKTKKCLLREGKKCDYCEKLFKKGDIILVERTLDYDRFAVTCMPCVRLEELDTNEGKIYKVDAFSHEAGF